MAMSPKGELYLNLTLVFTGHRRQMGTSAEQPGSRLSETEVSGRAHYVLYLAPRAESCSSGLNSSHMLLSLFEMMLLSSAM